MHSVVVYGDVRTHALQTAVDPERPNESGSSLTIYGGAFLMNQAVRLALNALGDLGAQEGGAEDLPEVFSFDKSLTKGANLGFQWRRWDLIPSKLVGENEERLRLKRPVLLSFEANEGTYPALSERLRHAIRKPIDDPKSKTDPGMFEDPAVSEMPWCPDIIVFDDLDGEIRSKLQYGPELDLEDPLTAPSRERAKNEGAFKTALSILVRRLQQAARHVSMQQKAPGVEPVIICSNAGRLPTCLNLDHKPETLWDVLLSEPVLRERTILLLDAADLRAHEGLAISTGLSWERTAQETVMELRRSERLRPFLGFGQIVVRYGATGALHIVRHGLGDRSFRLYFDPSQDDVAWSDTQTDGEVLGASSVFAGTFVQGLTRICQTREGRAILSDLPTVLGESIPTAIRRCQELFKYGYGRNGDSLEELKENQCFPKNLFKVGPSVSTARTISRADVPQQFLRNWSIINQSAQVRIGKVATEIVLKGVNVALNKPLPPPLPNVKSVERRVTRRIRDITVEYITEMINSGTPLPTAKSIRAKLLKDVRQQLVETDPIFAHWPPVRGYECLENGDSTKWQAVALLIRNTLRDLESQTKLQTIADASDFLSTAVPDAIKVLATRLKPHVESLVLRDNIVKLVVSSDVSELSIEPVAAPIVSFGDRYTVVDRREIEGVRAIQKMIKGHLDQLHRDRTNATSEKNRRPLSLAMFGPPGSGKSTAVKSIVSALKDHPTKTKVLDAFNLAQFTSEGDLSLAFEQIVSSSAQDEIPIAFFDEFDARLQTDEQGWLKFFLSPMEDGQYRGRPVRNAILVFAGGTAATFADFSLANRPKTDPQSQAFSRAKGPDFVSRLHGHLDVVGINPADADDELYLIRRAIVIRSLLSQIQNLGSDEDARIDHDMLRAVLAVPDYRNGARSLRMLLEMCSRSDLRRVAKSALPLIHQLNMLVDGKAFLDLIANVSAQITK